MIRKKLFIAALFFAIFGNSTVSISSANAIEDPTLAITAPISGSKISIENPIIVRINLNGGWASNLNRCDLPQDLSAGYAKRVFFAMVLIDEQGRARQWYDGSIRDTLDDWKEQIIPDGIECSFSAIPGGSGGTSGTHNGTWTAWSKSDSDRLSKILGTPISFSEEFGKPNRLVIAAGINSQNGILNLQRKTYEIAETSQPKFNFLGVNRGDTLSGIPKYSIEMTLGNNLSIKHFQSTIGTCEDYQKISSDAFRTKFKIDCILTPWDVGKNSSTVTLGAYVDVNENYIRYSADNVVANVGQIELPQIDIYNTRYSYVNNSIQLEFSGTTSIARPGSYSSSAEISPSNLVPVSVCAYGECKKLQIDSKGKFKYSGAFPGLSLTWSLEGEYKGVKLTKLNLAEEQGRLCNKRYTSASSCSSPIVFTGKVEKPKTNPPILIRVSKYSIPNKVKWGNNFKVTIYGSGSGTARCWVRYQFASANGESRGQYPFTLTAGKKNTVIVKPWYYKLADWPIGVLCIPNNWPPDNYLVYPIVVNMGRVTLIN